MGRTEAPFVLLPVRSLPSPGQALSAEIFRSGHSVPKPVGLALFFLTHFLTHCQVSIAPKETVHLQPGDAPQVRHLQAPREPSAPAQLRAASALLLPVQVVEHLHLRDILVGKDCWRDTFKVGPSYKLGQLFPWSGQGPADTGFPKVWSAVCDLVQRECKAERKKKIWTELKIQLLELEELKGFGPALKEFRQLK